VGTKEVVPKFASWTLGFYGENWERNLWRGAPGRLQSRKESDNLAGQRFAILLEKIQFFSDLPGALWGSN
jgi:hypothetical protein